MVNDPEGEGLNIRATLELLEHMASIIESGLITSGVDPAIANVFACLRFHITRPWGLALVVYNGKPRQAIVRKDDKGNVLIFAVVTEPGDDIKAVNGTPIDAAGCLPLSAFNIASTKH